MSYPLRTREEYDRLRARSRDADFAQAWTHLLARADEAVKAGLRPAETGAGWGHAYYCPDHVVVLDFDPVRPHGHRCPVDGATWRGESFDGGWRSVLNGHILGGLTTSALVWQATGQDRYRDHVADLLLDYASRYPKLPPHGQHVGLGRVTGQSLEEAVWGIGVAYAYDGVRESLDAADRQRIETDLLHNIGTHVTENLLHKIHNIECWHLAALTTLGVQLGEQSFLDTAFAHPHGLTEQLREGILDDGWWAEGSPSYHFYMLSAVLSSALALRHVDPGFLDSPRLRSTFEAPLTMLRSDLSLPALNDGWISIALPLGVGGYAAHYEQAYGLWNDPADAAFLRTAYVRGVPRLSEASLLMGPDLRATDAGASVGIWPPRPGRAVHPASGYAVLSDGTGRGERSLLVKYGLHGGGHGHPDKLMLDLHAFGVRLAPDPGSPAYNSPLQGPWFRQTLAHNTVVIGEVSQPEAQGRLLAHVAPDAGRPGVVDVAVSWPLDPDADRGPQGSWLREPRRVHVPAYAGVSIRRCVLWKTAPDGYFVDVVLVTTAGEEPVDLAWHHRGALVAPDPAALTADVDMPAWPPSGEAYHFLEDVRRLPAEHGGTAVWELAWEVDGAGTRMWGLDPDGSAALVATSPSNPPAERQATLLRRSRGPRVSFAAVVEPVDGSVGPDGNAGAVRSVSWRTNELAAGGPLRLDVALAGGVDRWSVSLGGGSTTDAAPGPVVEQHTDADETTYTCVLPHPW
ncbi:heparinase II/III family protein [Actinopolymorpha sp. NPDC004070]|uniref:heparinase II/III domain-containing protein n=1 Tax=Actinopolymorpha sp. NPDC004070 TaxID=3154548 RepID=UPI0033AD7925